MGDVYFNDLILNVSDLTSTLFHDTPFKLGLSNKISSAPLQALSIATAAGKNHETNQNKRFPQRIMDLYLFFVYNPIRPERLPGMRRSAPCGAPPVISCAYPLAAATPTCLHIPIQLNKPRFPLTALAPALPTVPFPTDGLWTRISATPDSGPFCSLAYRYVLLYMIDICRKDSVLFR